MQKDKEDIRLAYQAQMTETLKSQNGHTLMPQNTSNTKKTAKFEGTRESVSVWDRENKNK